MPLSPAPTRSENAAAANQFHVLNSSSGGSAGQASRAPAYLQLPSPRGNTPAAYRQLPSPRGDAAAAAAAAAYRQLPSPRGDAAPAYRQLPSPRANAATLGRSTPVRAMTTYSPPVTGGASAMALALRPQYGAVSPTQPTPPPHLLQQLMILARWGGSSSPRTPWMQSYAHARQPPSPFSPSGRARGMPPPSASPRIPAASTGAGRGTVTSLQNDAGGSHTKPRGRGTVAAVPSDAGGSHSNPRGSGVGRGVISTVQSDGGGSQSNPRGTSAGRGRLAGARSLQITPVNTTSVPPAEVNGDTAALQVLGPVLAMPTTGAAAKRKAAVRSPNGRLRKPRAPKGSSATPAGPKKVVNKKALVVSCETVGTHPGAKGIDHPKAVSLAPPPGKGRKRKSAASGAAPMPALTAPTSAATRCSLIARRNSSSSTVVAARAKKHTILTWLIDVGVLKEKEKVFYVPGPELAATGNNSNGKVVTGTVTRAGIQCSCCDTAMPLPAFTSHAGAETLQPVWERLLLMSGKPLLRCVQEAWEKEHVRTFRAEQKAKAALEQDRQRSAQAKKKLLAANGNGSANSRQNRKGPLALKGTNGGGGDRSDDACGICADGGQLLCCDSCPSTFHPECLGVQVPKGSWVCHYCRCFVCLATDGDLATCQQCTRKHHQHCRPSLFAGHEIGPYCSETCKKMAAKLSEMVGASNTAGGDGFSWSLLKIHKDSSATDSIAVLECNAKLVVALGVLDECFNPVKDRRTGIDMLRQAVFSLGSEFKRLSYDGFYTMVLEKDAEIISVALLRFHGSKLAEMPFAGTLPHYQRQGMMRRLVNAVEQVLSTLQVENLLIPAVAEVVDTWKRSFGFMPVEPRLREEANRLSTVVVTGTTLLQKHIIPNTAALAASSTSSKQQAEAEKQAQAAPAAPPMSEDELAFLEMSWPVCSFTDLVAGIAYSPRPLGVDPLSAAVRGLVGTGAIPGRSSAGGGASGRQSCGGEAAGGSGGGCSGKVFQMSSYSAAARSSSLRLGVNK
ncbi:uncharacterized protein [Lolium perenne]|nr:uncharacterized protein LOC127346037 isoform X2 [Lolium perenne]